MKNKAININTIKQVAAALGELNARVAFVGGAVVSLYANDPGAEDVRPTKDIDITFQIASFAELTRLQEELFSKGFYPSPDEDVICRFKYKHILVDVMATKEIGWAPANPWFKPAFKKLVTVDLKEITINILPPAYYLATKFTAFNDRGKDPRTSHDFEDIVYVLDNRIDLVEDILKSPDDVKEFLITQFQNLLQKDAMQEAILAHLEPAVQTERFVQLKDKLARIVDSL